VEQPCYKCGAAVEEGAPFCPECRAPQIRVNLPNDVETQVKDVPATPAFPPGTPGDLQPPARPVALPVHIRIRDVLGPVLASTVVLLVMAGLLPQLALIESVLAGALAVWLFARRRPDLRITGRAGARIGVYGGLTVFAFLFVSLVAGFVTGTGAELDRQLLQQTLQKMATIDPAMANDLGERLKSPDFMAAFVVIRTALVGLMLVGCFALGGALAARMVRRRRQ
jgi:hypothetical protein